MVRNTEAATDATIARLKDQHRKSGRVARLFTWLIFAGLFAFTVAGCTPAATEGGARKQVGRALAKIRANVKKYPALADSVQTRGRLEVPGRSGAATMRPPEDSAGFDKKLAEYAALKHRLGKLTDSLANAQGLTTAGVQAGTDLIAKIQQKEKALRQALRAGAYRDTVIAYEDSVLTGQFSFKKGVFAFTYTEKPRTVEYTAPALGLNLCPPCAVAPTFWQFWQFWAVVLLFLITFYLLITRK